MGEAEQDQNMERWADTSVRPSADVVAQRVEDEIVLVNLTTNAIYTLNRTGARAWELLEGGSAPTEIPAQLADEFDVERSEAAGELDRLLGELLEKQLVEKA